MVHQVTGTQVRSCALGRGLGMKTTVMKSAALFEILIKAFDELKVEELTFPSWFTW